MLYTPLTVYNVPPNEPAIFAARAAGFRICTRAEADSNTDVLMPRYRLRVSHRPMQASAVHRWSGRVGHLQSELGGLPEAEADVAAMVHACDRMACGLASKVPTGNRRRGRKNRWATPGATGRWLVAKARERGGTGRRGGEAAEGREARATGEKRGALPSFLGRRGAARPFPLCIALRPPPASSRARPDTFAHALSPILISTHPLKLRPSQARPICASPRLCSIAISNHIPLRRKSPLPQADTLPLRGHSLAAN